MVKMKPGGYSRAELQSALLYPNQTSPELQRAVNVVAKQWKAQARQEEEQRKATTKGWRK